MKTINIYFYRIWFLGSLQSFLRSHPTSCLFVRLVKIYVADFRILSLVPQSNQQIWQCSEAYLLSVEKLDGRWVFELKKCLPIQVLDFLSNSIGLAEETIDFLHSWWSHSIRRYGILNSILHVRVPIFLAACRGFNVFIWEQIDLFPSLVCPVIFLRYRIIVNLHSSWKLVFIAKGPRLWDHVLFLVYF